MIRTLTLTAALAFALCAHAEDVPSTAAAAPPPAASAPQLPKGRMGFLGSTPEVAFWLGLDEQVRTGDMIEVTTVMTFEPKQSDGTRYVVTRDRFDCRKHTHETLAWAALDDAGGVTKNYGPRPLEKTDRKSVVGTIEAMACAGKPGLGPVLPSIEAAKNAFVEAVTKK